MHFMIPKKRRLRTPRKFDIYMLFTVQQCHVGKEYNDMLQGMHFGGKFNLSNLACNLLVRIIAPCLVSFRDSVERCRFTCYLFYIPLWRDSQQVVSQISDVFRFYGQPLVFSNTRSAYTLKVSVFDINVKVWSSSNKGKDRNVGICLNNRSCF